MIKNKKTTVIFSFLFALSELILAALFHTAENGFSKYFGFFAVLLAALFALLFFSDSTDYFFTQLGLIFTVFADIFLVLLSAENKLIGMCLFSVTQIFYFLLLYSRDAKFRKAHLFIRLSVAVAALVGVMLVLGERTDALSLVSLFYYANLAVNVLWAFSEIKVSRLLPFGLLLFALCDVCIGLSVMSDSYLPLSEGSFLYFLANPPFNLAWVFYIPAQTLIALTLAEAHLKSAE